MEGSHEKDLPLLANSDQMLIRHFILDLECNMDDHTFSGDMILFLDPSRCSDENMHVFSIQEYQTSANRSLRKVLHHSRQKSLTKPSADWDNQGSAKLHTKCMGPTSDKALDIDPTHLTRLQGEGETQNLGKHDSTTEEQNHCGHKDAPLDLEKTIHKSKLSHNPQELFLLTLESVDIDIISVEELPLECPELTSKKLQECFCSPWTTSRGLYKQFCDNNAKGKPLGHKTEAWCLRIWKEGVFDPGSFPQVIAIRYKTKPEGASLRWVKDRDGRPCVYSAGMWINNRSLLPCQEYGCLSTWQVFIRAPQELAVLLTGDSEDVPGPPNELGLVSHYFESRMPLPSFTLAIAIGHWEHEILYDTTGNEETNESYLTPTCHHKETCQIPFSRHPVVTCRVFAARSLLPTAASVLRDCYPSSCRAIQRLLGPLPFPRVDILIYPPSSQDMAMSNPSLLFLSQSLLCEASSMSIRLGHELSHFWFGLFLGAKDWTEEWLSEGFATYVEDSIHASAVQWTQRKQTEHSEIRALVRYHILKGELDNTNTSLQTLRPNQGKEQSSADGKVMYVKDGLNPEKLFTQVHYLKGYFLLRHLATIIGTKKFDCFLKDYIVHHHGEMVTSKDFLTLLFASFPELQDHGVTITGMYEDWLDCSGLPKGLVDKLPDKENSLYRWVTDELEKWLKLDRQFKRMKHPKRRRLDLSEERPKLMATQIVLLLDGLLEKARLSLSTLKLLNKRYSFSLCNADVLHRWCELIIKHRHKSEYPVVADFLINHQAMGVYLYGEMVISRCPHLTDLARDCFRKTGPEMEATTRRTVQQMVYGC